MSVNVEELQEFKNTIDDALAILQCAEDSTTEDHVKRALSIANGNLLTVQQALSHMIDRAKEAHE